MSKGRWPRKLWPLALLFRILAGCASSEAAEPMDDAVRVQGDVLLYGEWAVGCDNLGTCRAVALLRESDSGEPPVHIQMTFTDQISDAQSIQIWRGSEMLEGLSQLAAHKLQEQLLDTSGSDVVHVYSKAMHYDVPRKGFADVSGLLAQWRALPPQQLNSTAAITPIPAARIDKPVIHPALRGIAKRCPKGHMGSSMQAWRLISGATLWRAACGDEGLNPISFWAVSGPQGAPPSFITFEDGDTDVRPFNSWFDDSSGYLRMVHYYGHWQSFTEDCGMYRAYAWGKGEMKLLEKRYMPTCGTGIGPEGWIITYRAPVLNGPDSGP